MDDARPRSLFLVLEYCYKLAPYFTILQLETQSAHLTPKEIKVDQDETPKVDQEETQKEIFLDPEDYLVRFDESLEPLEHSRIKWLFCPPTSSTEDLYMVPNWESSPSWETIKPLHGYKFNFSTGSFGSIKAPTSSQSIGHVVNVKGDIYFMGTALKAFGGTRKSFFECYDHYTNSWKAPETSPHSHSILGPIYATAVWGDIFLLNVNVCDIWAYDSSGNKWYIVDAKDGRCYNIRGDAIVVGDTIYALTNSYDLVLALHIKKEGTGSDVVFECSVRSEYIVEGMEQKSILKDMMTAVRRSRHFVHLGKDKFCVVECCQLRGDTYTRYDYEPIQLIYIEECKGENKMTMTGTCIHRVKILQPDQQFVLRFCFSLPESSESKTTTLKEGKRLVFKFNPFAEDYASKPGQEPGGADPLLLEPQLFTSRDPDPSKLPASATSLSPPEQRVVEIRPPRQKPGKAAILKAKDYASKPGQEPGGAERVVENLPTRQKLKKAAIPELGHTITVRKLPPKTNARQVEMVMKRFGRTKGVQVVEKEEGQCVAYVEFQSATSKRRALEVSTVSIGGRVAEILETRLTAPL